MGTTDLAKRDEELLVLLGQNDASAFEIIFNQYYPDLCKFTSIYIKDYSRAEELIADLFMKLWDKRNLLQIQSLKHYLFVSARHMALNEIQRTKNLPRYLEDEDQISAVADQQLNPQDVLTSKESYQEIVALINLLPARQREVLLMSRIDLLNKTHIAELLEISVRTVETLLYQSIKSFRSLVSNTDQGYKI